METNHTEIIELELERINTRARDNRKRIRKLLPVFEYSHYSYGMATVKQVCKDFEEYLEISAALPTKDVELHSYDLHWHESQNDSVVITHRHKFGKSYNDHIDYKFVVMEPDRTLTLLTEGKCKIVTRTTQPSEPVEYTALSCSDSE